MKTFLIVLGVILLVAFFTNPEEQVHRDAVTEVVKAESGVSGEGDLIGNIVGGGIASFMVKNTVTRENYYVFSKTKVTLGGVEDVIGYGAFGYVYVLENKVKEKLEGGL